MKTGLVLEGGALRTIFSSGVCDALIDLGLTCDYLVGVSAGIAYGVSYLSGQKGRNLEILTRYARDKRYMGFRNLLRRDNRCYFGLKFAYEQIPNELIPFDYDAFAAWDGEVEAVVTSLESGKAVYLPVPREDEHFLLLQATCAMSLLFPIFDLGDGPVLDGGVADAIPFERALERGCDRLTVVLTRERDYHKKPERLQPLIDLTYRRWPAFCDAMRRRAERYEAQREKLFALEREGRVLILEPKSTAGFSRVEQDLDKIRALWQEGYDEGIARREELAAFLKPVT